MVKRSHERQDILMEQDKSDNIARLKETILREYPRLSSTDKFKFECGPHLDCFNDCCADVNIFLTPYDVLRMRKELKMGSSKFLHDYAIIPFDDKQTLPVPLMLMEETDKKQCHFVDDEKGCTIYNNRPWPCRMYPLGMASPSEMVKEDSSKFFFLLNEDHCHGHKSDKEWTVEEWIADQGIEPYDEFGELFKVLTIHDRLRSGWKPTPKHVEIYWMGLYDLDKFRKMIFESSFLDRYEIPDDEIATVKTDDEALLRLGFRWVSMALFGERSIPIRNEEDQKARLEAKILKKSD
jgi:Fe-S-cluster containining protein